MDTKRTFKWTHVTLVVAVAAAVVSGHPGTASAEEAVATAAAPPPPVHVFAQAGVGMVELAHLEVGAFLGPHVGVEAMAAWNGVYGPRYGGGAFAIFGHAQGSRPPRHGLLLGARLMLDSGANFDSGGDDLSSYAAIPVGYSFLADNGFFLRASLALAVVRERRSHQDIVGQPPVIDHRWTAGGPLLNASVGFAF